MPDPSKLGFETCIVCGEDLDGYCDIEGRCMGCEDEAIADEEDAEDEG